MEISSGVERRRHPRLSKPFPACVCNIDACGQACASATVRDNVSAGGLCVRLRQRLEPGAQLCAVIRLAPSPLAGAPAPRVAVRGVVLRVEIQPDGRYGVEVAFTRHCAAVQQDVEEGTRVGVTGTPAFQRLAAGGRPAARELRPRDRGGVGTGAVSASRPLTSGNPFELIQGVVGSGVKQTTAWFAT
jgi:hypothetical protein